MKFQDIYQFFQEPPPIYLGKEVAVCYILAMLLKYGDSYGTELIQRIEEDYTLYRLSDTVLYGALKFLEDEGVVEGYWQKVEGRGRPRRMYQVQAGQYALARELSELWYDYALQSPGEGGQASSWDIGR